jgi:PTS system mannose-specific IID component
LQSLGVGSITPLHVFLLGLFAFLCAVDELWLVLGVFTPLISGVVTGLVIGDPLTGLIVGSLLQFIFTGLAAIGGGTVPDPATGTIAAVVIASVAGLKPEAAVALALPIGYLTMNIEIGVRSFCAVFSHWADREIERGNFDRLPLINMLGLVPWGLSRAVPVWALLGAVAVNPEGVKAFIESLSVIKIGPLTVKLWDALGVAGGVLPALGVAIMMRMMLSRLTLGYFVLGFVLAAYLKLNLLPIALIGASLALTQYMLSYRDMLEGLRGQQAPAEPKGTATRKDFLRWLVRSFFLQSSWNYERMQGTGFAHTMLEIEKKLRKDPEELKSWMRMHNEFYNTNPWLHNLVYGMVISLEEQGADLETVRGVKTALMGPVAGLGDSIMWFVVIPVSFLIGASLGSQGNFAGPILSLLICFPVAMAVRYYSLVYGYRYGLSLAEVLRGEVLKVFREAVTAFAMAVVGGIAALYVKARAPLVVATVDSQQIQLQFILDQIMPSLLPLAFTLFAYWLIKYKNVSYGKAAIILFLTALLLGVLGILG